MKLRRIFVLVFVVLACCLVFTNVFAEEKKYELNTASVIKDILIEQTGKRVYLRMDSGEEVLGIVAKVGDHLVHISGLAGRDFYDATIRIDRISAIIFKVRGN